ncbi:uncharacterized protein PAC_00058 [Phialocephala subalpina]|uniref:Uncharacterized protein n=1 Tax=Phialocephala subalpina TaxID=576137 RepID=A0A1L7WBM6_9HELO|nr:uncharacterized protein PAC_00058 [Phialocephala subalpina]
MLSSDYCSYFVLSPVRTILEPLIVPALLLAYLPQYVETWRYGTAGISGRFMLCLCLCSTLQLAARLVNPAGAPAVNCILYREELRGIKAFSALIGYFQVLSQWLCAMIWLYFFLRFRNSERDAEYAPLLANEDGSRHAQDNESSARTSAVPRGMSSDQMFFVVFAHAFFFLGTAIGLLVAPKASGLRGPADGVLQSLCTYVFHLLCIWLGLVQVIALCVAQVRDAWTSPRAKGISILSLALQVAALLALAVLQLFRPRAPLLPSWRTEFWGKFFEHWALSANYCIMVIGHVVALFIRAFPPYRG